MDGAELSREQRTKLAGLLHRQRDQLCNLQKRMEAIGWYTDDPVYNAVIAAYHILHAASNALPREPFADPTEAMRQQQFREKRDAENAGKPERKLIA